MSHYWRCELSLIMFSTNKPRPPVPSSMDVCDLGGVSGPPRIHMAYRGCWANKSHHPRRERLKIATYNARTLLKELEEELTENNMKWDVIGLGDVRRKEEGFTTLQSGHLLYHSEANNGQASLGILISKKWKDNITRVTSGNSRVAEPVLPHFWWMPFTPLNLRGYVIWVCKWSLDGGTLMAVLSQCSNDH